MDFTMIASGYASLKAATDIAKGLLSANTSVEVNDAKLDLQSHLFAAHQSLFEAQQALASFQDRERELKSEISRLKDWSVEREAYELADAGSGALAFRKKAVVESNQPAHWLCPTCFEDGKKSFLQPEHHAGMTNSLRCSRCGAIIVTRGRPEHLPAAYFKRGGM